MHLGNNFLYSYTVVKTQTRKDSKKMPHPQTAAVFISTFPVTDKKQIGERERERASRADMKKVESEEERANVEVPRWEPEDIPHARLTKSEEKKNWQASFLFSLPHTPPVMCRVQRFWAPAV